jgi:hypothetical protein
MPAARAFHSKSSLACAPPFRLRVFRCNPYRGKTEIKNKGVQIIYTPLFFKLKASVLIFLLVAKQV